MKERKYIYLLIVVIITLFFLLYRLGKIDTNMKLMQDSIKNVNDQIITKSNTDIKQEEKMTKSVLIDYIMKDSNLQNFALEITVYPQEIVEGMEVYAFFNNNSYKMIKKDIIYTTTINDINISDYQDLLLYYTMPDGKTLIDEVEGVSTTNTISSSIMPTLSLKFDNVDYNYSDETIEIKGVLALNVRNAKQKILLSKEKVRNKFTQINLVICKNNDIEETIPLDLEEVLKNDGKFYYDLDKDIKAQLSDSVKIYVEATDLFGFVHRSYAAELINGNLQNRMNEIFNNKGINLLDE